MLSAGFSAEECEAIRGLDRDVVLDHAMLADDSGWNFQAAWCISPELLDSMETLVEPDEPESIESLLSQLPEGTRHKEVQLFLKCRGRASAE